jgi:fructosamine-3-kinase
VTPELQATIAAAICAATGHEFRARQATRLAGGSIHSAWRLADGGRRYFVKTTPCETHVLLLAEAGDLEILRAADCLRVPRVVVQGSTATTAFLVLEWLDLQPLDRRGGGQLGEALAALHRHGAARHGAAADNFIGTTPQENAWSDNWPRFYARHRLLPQFRLAAQRGMERELVAQGERLIEKIPALFVSGHPAPSLLHGDLWSGNAAQLDDGTPVIFDPASYYGDREADLAMAELFGGFPENFYAAYRAAWPVSADYETRKLLYNLYHVLNHFNLFGASYLGQARRMTGMLLAELRA